MLNSFSGWLFNLMLWGAVVTLVTLLYAAFVTPEVLYNPLNAYIALGVIAAVSLIWPKF